MYEELDKYIDTFATYKQICETTGLNYQKGNGKIAQISEIERYYNIEKIKTKYYFIERYDTPLEKEDNRMNGNNTKYADDIETVMLYALQNYNKQEYICSVPQALLTAELINENYQIVRRDIPIVSKILNIDENNIYNFYNNTHRKLKETFERALNKMRNKALIFYTTEIMIAYNDVNIMLDDLGDPKLDANGKLQYHVGEIHRKSNENEKELILKCEGDILDEMGYESKQDVFLHRKWNDYRNRITSLLKSKSNIKYYYDAYCIILNKERIDKTIRKYQNMASKNYINYMIIESLKESNTKKYNKTNDEQVLNDNNKLIDILIDNDCKVIIKSEILSIKKNKQTLPAKEEVNLSDDEDNSLPF